MDQEITLKVGGMTCQNCVRHVSTALRKLEGVREVEVRLAEGDARVTLAAGGATLGEMLAAVQDAGYEAQAV
ncbi:heavy-metal-associated domain-containing protein [Chondromyces crocatus]|uniref:Heavy metal transport/detoxification protein n=1 Tax=Chondromyces crocatus TaxID=52 RepID=A0A0K1EHI1_CHOCO|nr:heavy-metal-associated domain-containing protein [Chondromyces crocatus]AKT40331.1 heavy metal transport/detoxification protein [Chondromyces crocatus]